MCSLCLSGLAWIAVSGGGGTLAALIIGNRISRTKDENDERQP